MIARRFGYLASVCVLLGCGFPFAPGAGTSEAHGGAPVATSARPAPPRSPELSAAARAIRLTRASAAALPLPTPRLSLHRPALGEILEEPLVHRYELRLEVRNFVLTRAGQGAIVSLDGKRPRRWPPEGSLRLGDLLPENEPLAAGAHVLLVALVDDAGRVLRGRDANGQAPFFVVDFSIAIPVKLPRVAQGRVFCLSPSGTYYGDEGQAARLELLGVGPVDNPLALRIQGRGVDLTTPVDPDKPYLIAGLPLGDVRITSASAHARELDCITTLNPELPARGR